MAFTIGGFAEDIDSAGANVNITALPDPHLFTSGDNLRVPNLNQLSFVFGGLGSGGDGLMRLASPSLRDISRLVVAPINGLNDGDVEPSDPPAVMDMSRHPRQLATDEQLQVVIDSDTSAASFQWLFLGLSDGVPTVPSGEIVTVHATSSTTVTARAWTTTTVSFADTLPTGRYQVVGLRAVGATMIAARLVFKPGTWRPGCIASDAQTTIDSALFRAGNLGIWGEFESVTPFDIEVVCGSADSAQSYSVDLIQVG